MGKLFIASVVAVIVIFVFNLLISSLKQYDKFEIEDLNSSLRMHMNLLSSSNSLNTSQFLIWTNKYIRHRLKVAESNWIRANKRLEKIRNQTLIINGMDISHTITIWDLFYPSFDCPWTKERIGRIGDGGKWVCGFEILQTKPKCIVYSFGINMDTSFEEEIIKRTKKCIIRMFDPTLKNNTLQIVSDYPQRAFFYPIGLSYRDSLSERKYTLQSLMQANGDDFLDILKIDIEGNEWNSIIKITKDFPFRLPFGQLQVEIHLDGLRKKDWMKILTNWWIKLEDAGLRIFNIEPNLLGRGSSSQFVYREAAFLNIKSDDFKIS